MKQIVIFTLIALIVFKDKITNEIIQPGGTLQTDDLTRVNDLVQRGLAKIVSVDNPVLDEQGAGDNSGNADAKLVEFQGAQYSLDDVKAALKEIGAGVNANAGIKGVSDKLATLSEDQYIQLQEKLTVTEQQNGNYHKIRCSHR